ncbi:MAG: polyphosphate:AMP phosphotransferase [Xanthomonadales bacterium]|nr:polyphosphate:AMP phosphotransferase [Xanthomonadales bacterium]
MLRQTEKGAAVSDTEFKDRQRVLWPRLLTLQQRLRKQGKSPVLVDFAGVRGAGKSEMVNLLNTWMDARWITTHGFDPEREREAVRPRMWRYWMRLPPRGQIGLYLSGRYTPLLLERVYGELDDRAFDYRIQRIRLFENMLAADGALIQKFWLHIDRETLEQRLRQLEQDPDLHWRVTDSDWKHWDMNDRFVEVSDEIIARTSTEHAPWTTVEAVDSNHRSLVIGEAFGDTLERHLSRGEQTFPVRISAAEPDPQAAPTPSLKQLDLDQALPREEYEQALPTLQARLGKLQQLCLKRGQSAILVFEGPDASGKGGAIRRLTQSMDARGFKVYPFAAPTAEEHAHHYLWRFWRCVPRDGQIAIFDRSWYGRVLVERVEGLASDGEWQRAYGEITEFENELVSHGIVLLKFWVHIDQDEQLKRFRARESKAHKQWKLTDEDWRNRDRWHEYEQAANDMLRQTDAVHAPWHVIEGNSKRRARIRVLSTVCQALERALPMPR